MLSRSHTPKRLETADTPPEVETFDPEAWCKTFNVDLGHTIRNKSEASCSITLPSGHRLYLSADALNWGEAITILRGCIERLGGKPR